MPRDEPAPRYDAIVIGAGLSGMYQLHSLRQLGLSARAAPWLLLSRGLNRETVDAQGRTVSHVTDETTNRGFWRHYRAVMTQA